MKRVHRIDGTEPSVVVTACSVAKADIWQVGKANVYLVAVLLAVLLLVTYVPVVPMVLVEFLVC